MHEITLRAHAGPDERGSQRTIERRRLPPDSTRDLFRQLLSVAVGLREPAFRGVGQKTTLNQHGWTLRPAQHEESAPANSPILGRSARNDVSVDAGRECGAVAPVVIGFDAVGAAARWTSE